MSGTKSNDRKKPDLRDGMPGHQIGGVVDAEFVGDEPAHISNGPDITKPGVSKHPAGQTTQE